MLIPLKNRRGEGYIDAVILVFCVMLVIALAVRVMPVYMAKQRLDTFAYELCREAQIAGRIGTETTRRQRSLEDETGLHPVAIWSVSGRVQLNGEITVTLSVEREIGMFAGFGSFPVTLRSQASGKSEVYWK
jgi:hypothetical protein